MLERQETSHNHETDLGLVGVEELRAALCSGCVRCLSLSSEIFLEINVSLVALIVHWFPSELETFSASGPPGDDEVSS